MGRLGRWLREATPIEVILAAAIAAAVVGSVLGLPFKVPL